MNRNLKFWLTGAVLTVFSAAKAQQSESFIYTPQQPKPGETVEIIYDPAGTPLAGSKEVHAVAYVYNSNYRWQTVDVNMKPANGNKFNGQIAFDKSFGMATLKFTAGDSTDNNKDMSYTIMAAGTDGGPYNAPGAYAGWGLLRAERFGYGIPGYFKDPKLTDTAFYYWMNNEIVRHPKESSSALAVPFAKGVWAYQKEAAIPRIRNVIGYLTKLGGEENLLKVREIYSQVLRQKPSVDSLDAVMLKDYPQGSVARLMAYKKLNEERDFNKKITLSEQFLVDFPMAKTDAGFDEENRISYSTVYQNIVVLNVMNKNFDILTKYIDSMPYYAVINIYYKIIEIAHKREDQTDQKLAPYAKMLVNRMETFRNQQPAEFWFLLPNEWTQHFEKDMVNNLLISYVNILKNTGENQEGLKYALEAQSFLNYKTAPLNYDEVVLLQKNGQANKVSDVLIKSMYENQATPEMLDMLKANYVAQYKTEDGFDKYLESLKNAALSVASKAKMEMIKKDMPDWSMYDAAGKLIKFKELRGKTIVMDFWATWCVPCKASFPGMKLAVEKYKKDPNVAFYFVDTEERTANYKAEVNKFIKDNNYPFHILFDNKVKGGTMTEEVYNSICKAFTISGIPQKLIIDKNCKVRFIAVGYYGSASALADEMSEMIEATKKAN
ncbi:TlpA disulfide reductase family protein [Mucilaginibacter sp.]|uniref:TlpA family protein disulfide reductase n=1 Tax=Mucilaginibacter sp. TaxID=1882438 RepID=UPI002ED39CB1